jgi:hypothetical protein
MLGILRRVLAYRDSLNSLEKNVTELTVTDAEGYVNGM